eukprot:9496739-Pyramimonas_sp.AAC.1
MPNWVGGTPAGRLGASVELPMGPRRAVMSGYQCQIGCVGHEALYWVGEKSQKGGARDACGRS